jgi:HD-GYP domain-containing protein (c-di-GMP phosphodiesterase class II)
MRLYPKRYEPTKILLDVSRAIVSSLDPDTVSNMVLKKSRAALGADHASLFLVDDETGFFFLHEALGFSADEIENIKLLGGWEVINEEVVKKRRALIINNIKSSPLFKDKELPFSHEKIPIKSFIAAPLEKDDRIIGILILSNSGRPGHSFTVEDEKLLMGLSNDIAIAVINARLYKNLKDLYLNTVKSLVKAIEAKDHYTGGHSERVMEYALAIGKEMKLHKETLENVRLSSLLHDIGKVGVKDDILIKNTELSEHEKEEINKHPSIGAQIVESIAKSRHVTRGILEHHERFGGGGYPCGLKGNAISIEARIVAVADAWDALTTDRPYQKSVSKEEAYKLILEGSGSRFDPKVVKAFVVSREKHPGIWDR